MVFVDMDWGLIALALFILATVIFIVVQLGWIGAPSAPAIPARLPFVERRTEPLLGNVKIQERIFVGESITIEHLTDFFADHTAIQAMKLTEVFIGKWMRIAGAIDEVVPTRPGHAQVSFRDIRDPYLFLYFEDQWIERLAIMKPGDKLEAIGRISKIDRLAVSLENCELMNR